MKKIFLTIALLISCSMTSILYAQSYEAKVEAANKVRVELKPYMDTLDFEYEGPLQIHEEIIVRVISHIQKKIDSHYDIRYMAYPLLKSYNRRISSLAENYVEKNAKVRIAKVKSGYKYVEYKEYDLVNSLNTINYRISTSERLIGPKYIEVLFSQCNVQNQSGHWTFSKIKEKVLDNIENNDFATLLSEAERNGIKKTATENGFYNKKLAKQLAEVILINKIENLYKSNKELVYRVVYIADANTALHKLTYESEQEEMLEIMINKY